MNANTYVLLGAASEPGAAKDIREGMLKAHPKQPRRLAYVAVRSRPRRRLQYAPCIQHLASDPLA